MEALKTRLFVCLFPSLFLVLLSGCLGTQSSSRRVSGVSSASQEAPSLPPAMPGNAIVAINDEAPILRDASGQPIRQDKESQAETIHFDGFNEE